MNKVKILILENANKVGKEAADQIKKEMKKLPSLKIGLASGLTMLPFFKHLSSKKINFSKIKTFNLDEYVGFNKENEQSFYRFMEKNLFKRIKLKEEQINFLNGKAKNLAKECKSYESKIRKGINIQLLGLGRNGHIGFNEPGSSFKSKTRKIKLSMTTRKDNSRFFKSINQVPTHALTMGIDTILKSKKIILLATGKHKANAVAKTIQGPITTAIPASVLRKHKNVTFILDKAAASKLYNTKH